VKTEDKVDLPPLEKETRPEPKPAPTIAKEERERRTMNETTAPNARAVMDQRINPGAVAEETSVITAGTTLTGDITSDGSFDIQGTINGNVTCNGKLVVTGAINGNSAASEIFADVAKIEGEVVSSGTVKIGAGSVIIGNISAASAVIAGAIKGDIDVQGPVVVDTSAVVMGNIKSRSVQINNGAVIEGFCSQCYAEIDVESLFEGR
jgi:cytoskeletal protein CcmA (bactofilin family)